MSKNAVDQAASLINEALQLLRVPAGVQSPSHVLGNLVPNGVQLYAQQARGYRDERGVWWYYLSLSPTMRLDDDCGRQGWRYNHDKGYYWNTGTGRPIYGPKAATKLGLTDFANSEFNNERNALKAGLVKLLDVL